MTQIDLGNIRINWRGPYDNATDYVRHDAVAHLGSSYVAKRPVSGITPVQGDDWDLMAAGTDQLTDEGDFLIHDGNTPVRLPRGNNAQVIQMVGNQPAWRDQSLDPARRVWKLGTVNRHGGWYTRTYLMADGTIKACGYGGNNSNGDPAGSHLYVPTRVSVEEPETRFVEVFSGGQQHYGLTANGEVWSWGHNNYGQLGHGDTANRSIAKRIEYFVTNNIQIARVICNRVNYYDYGVAYFLTTTGELYACGYNGNGNLGNGTTSHQYTPVRCGALENIVDVGVSGLPYTIYAVEADGSFWVWGWNAYGQLGLGDTTLRSTPILNATINNAVKGLPTTGYTTAGNGSTGSGFVLLADGSIWGAGYNGHGQLGQGDTAQRNSFTQISHPDTFIDIFASCGRYCTIGALNDQGEVYFWGYNGYGQLGTGNTTQQTTPFKPNAPFQGNVTKAKIAGGSSYIGSIVQAGNELWAAGYNGNGNLGFGNSTSTNNTFKKVLGVSGTIQDWSPFGHGTTPWGLGVLYDDGRVDACGENNSYGECGTQPANIHDNLRLTNVLF